LTVRPKRILGLVAVLLAGSLLVPAYSSARDKTGSSSTGKSTTPKRNVEKPAVAKDSRKASLRSRKRGRRISYRYRLARLKLEPQRVEEIQQALMQAGYLQRQPTGRWDDLTKDAMRRYQADHGFASTGLPEAKSLMKLGLGPHPLPEDCDPTAQAQADSASRAPSQPRPSSPSGAPTQQE
jgi:peptidoglycan hydrolase-like protein with peptidoglycan-binding domain